MKKETSNWDLEALLRSRAFVELSESQQQWVLKQMSVEQYNERRWVLLASSEFLAGANCPPPPSLQSVLRKTQPRQKGFDPFVWFQYFSTFRVPVWQLGMAILCGWLIGLWNAGQKNSSLSIVPQIVYQTDTIVKEIPVYMENGRQLLSVFADSQRQGVMESRKHRSPQPASGVVPVSNTSIARDRELLDLAVGME